MQPDRDLDRELRDLAPRVEYPPTPDLARSVRSRLEAESAGAGAPARTGPSLWWIAAAAIVLLVALPVLATVLSTSGAFMSGGAAGGGGAAESGGAESGREGPAGVAESSRPPQAMESGVTSSARSSAGSCFSPAPTLDVKPSRGAPGDEFGIRGEHIDGDLRDCDDDPARDVRVELLQDRRTWELGRLESGKDSRLAAKLRVPADARPGRATVRATYGQGPPGSPHGRQTVEVRFLVVGGDTAPADG